MNLHNKIFWRCLLGIFLVFLTVVAALDASAQRKNQKEKSLEDIPESALLPPISGTFINQKIADFTEWCTAPYKKGFDGATVELKPKVTNQQKPSAREIQAKRRAAKKNGLKYESDEPKGRVVTLSKAEFNQQLLCIKMFLSTPIMTDDLEEATGIKRTWFQNLINTALTLKAPIYEMDAAREALNEETYNIAWEQFRKLAKKFEDTATSKPTKLSEKEMKSLKAKNIQRRAKAYWISQEQNAAKRKMDAAVREKGVGK